MNNVINSGNIDQLTVGEVLLVQAIKVAGNKIQLEFAEVLNEAQNLNPLSIFNKSDDRFSGGRARRAWLTAEPSDAGMLLGLNFGEDAGWVLNENNKQVVKLNVLNPMVNIGGTEHQIKVEIVETTTPTEWQAANIERSAKRRGALGDFITHQGKYIFVNSRVAFNKANHVFLQADGTLDANHLLNARLGVDLSTGEIFS